MGKYISLAVSNSVSKAEWVQAYEETLRFLKIFPLAERRKVNVKGIVQIASLNGHLCHIWRPACDLNGGQPRTH